MNEPTEIEPTYKMCNNTNNIEKQDEQSLNQKKMYEERLKTETILFVLRQTNYDEYTVKKELEKTNYDPMPIIKKYMGVEPQKIDESNMSTNQKIYKTIRKML